MTMGGGTGDFGVQGEDGKRECETKRQIDITKGGGEGGEKREQGVRGHLQEA